MFSDYDSNKYFLKLGNYTPECFDVISFFSQSFYFNADYSFTIKFKRHENIDLSVIFNQYGYLKFYDKILHGVITQIKDYNDPGILADEIVLSSPLSLLNQTPKSAVYADVDFVKLMTTVLTEAGWCYKIDFDFLLKTQYPIRKYIAQYQETDYEFILRHCANWGIFCSFIQKANKAVLLFCDDILLLEKQFEQINLRYNISDQLYHSDYCIQEFACKRKILTKTVRLNDYNPETPSLSLKLEKSSSHKIKSFGIDYRPYEYYENRSIGELILNRRLEYYDCEREVFSGITDRYDLSLGQHIEIIEHPISFMNGHYHITNIIYDADIAEDQACYLKVNLLKVHIAYRSALNKLFYMQDCIAKITSDNVNENGYYYISPYFDERKQFNTYPVRQNQPLTGENSGFHFPLKKDTDVLISHINGDPDRPIIMGAILNENSPNPVTDMNDTQHIIQTTAGHLFLIDNKKDNPNVLISTPNQAVFLQMNNAGLSLNSKGDGHVEAKQDIVQNSKGDFIQTVGNNHTVKVQGDYILKTNDNNVTFQSAKDLVLNIAKNLSITAQDNMMLNANNAELNAQAIEIQASQISLKSTSDINADTENIELKSQGKIIISQAGASIIIDQDSITLNAKEVNFNTTQFIAPQIQVGSGTGENPEDKLNSDSLLLKFVDIHQNFWPEIFSSMPLFIDTPNNETVGVAAVNSNVSVDNIQDSNFKISHPGLAAIGVNNKPQAPSFNYQVDKKENTITCLQPPIFKSITGDGYKLTCEDISDEELSYFKQQGNNVLIFLHGYNVDKGEFPGKNLSLIDNPDYEARQYSQDHSNIEGVPVSAPKPDKKYYFSYSGNNWTTLRTLQESIEVLQKDNESSDKVDYVKNNYTDQSECYDYANGTEACNWLLHMEYNLNCAAVNQYPFPWGQKALEYTRVLAIHWPGFIPILNIPYTNYLTFRGAELNAIASAHALVTVIKKLKDLGLTINIIAHSLGNMVLLKMLDILGRQSKDNKDMIDQVIMWEAAVASDALSQKQDESMEEKIKEMQTSQNIDNDMSFYKKYLSFLSGDHKLAKDISENYFINEGSVFVNRNNNSHENYYAKNPFAYFPFAADVAKQFTVISSKHDSTLHVDRGFYEIYENLINEKLPRSALGYSGSDQNDHTIQKMMGHKKIIFVPPETGNLISFHSAMKIPTQDVFEKIYKGYVLNKANGIKLFGEYNIK